MLPNQNRLPGIYCDLHSLKGESYIGGLAQVCAEVSSFEQAEAAIFGRHTRTEKPSVVTLKMRLQHLADIIGRARHPTMA